jgi:hypothetical protein
MAYATTAELGTFLGRTLAATEEGKAGIVLDVVSEAIDGHVGTRTVADTTKTNVALLAGRRLFETPDGVRQEILGDWQASYAPSTLLSQDEKGLLDSGGTGGTKRPRFSSPRTPSDLWEYAETTIV